MTSAMVTVPCGKCGKEFEARKYWQRFCSKECRVGFWNDWRLLGQRLASMGVAPADIVERITKDSETNMPSGDN